MVARNRARSTSTTSTGLATAPALFERYDVWTVDLPGHGYSRDPHQPLELAGVASMIAARGMIQREGEVVHFVVHRLTDLSDALASVGSRGAFPLPHGRGDEFHTASPTPDARHPKPRDMFIRDLHLDTIRVRTREFR